MTSPDIQMPGPPPPPLPYTVEPLGEADHYLRYGVYREIHGYRERTCVALHEDHVADHGEVKLLDRRVRLAWHNPEVWVRQETK